MQAYDRITRQRGHRSRNRIALRWLLLLALAAIPAIGIAGVTRLPGGLLMMLPALALAVVMLTRPYIGERALARLRRRWAERAPRATQTELLRARAPRRHAAATARGGRLIAAALAGRAPPPALAGCR